MFPICAVFVVFWGHLRQSGQSSGARICSLRRRGGGVPAREQPLCCPLAGEVRGDLEEEDSWQWWGWFGGGHFQCVAEPMEEFPTLQDLISLEDPDVPPLWGTADLPEESATETVTIQDPSAITVTVLTNQSPDLPRLLLLNRYLHLALPRVMQLRLHPRILLNARM